MTLLDLNSKQRTTLRSLSEPDQLSLPNNNTIHFTHARRSLHLTAPLPRPPSSPGLHGRYVLRERIRKGLQLYSSEPTEPYRRGYPGNPLHSDRLEGGRNNVTSLF